MKQQQIIRHETIDDTPAAGVVVPESVRVLPPPPPYGPVDAVVGTPATVVRPAVTEVVDAPRAVRTSSVRYFAPDAIAAAIVGVALLLFGLVAVTRAGIEAPLDDPVVEVLGFDHTATLGMIEIGIGVLLLIAGVMGSRSAALFFGSMLGIGAFVGAVQTESFSELGLESSFAWANVVAGVVIVLAALLLPRVLTRSSSVTHTPL